MTPMQNIGSAFNQPQKPLLHFAHANGFPAGTYNKMLAVLAQHYTICALPAFGLNPAYPVNANWQNSVQELIAFLENQCQQHQVKQAFCVGHSYGAYITLLAAYQRPDLIKAAILLDPPTITGLKSFMLWLGSYIAKPLVDKVSPAHLALRRRDTWPSKQNAAELLKQKPLFAALDADCFNDYIAYGLSPTAQNTVTLTIPKTVEADVFRYNPNYLWYKPRHAPKPPCLLVTAGNSIFYRTGMIKTAAGYFKLPLKVVDGGHLFPLERPIQTGEWIMTELNKLAP